MWEISKNRIAPKKRKEKKCKDVKFPPISDELSKTARLTGAHRLQELFFSHCLADYGPLERIIKSKKTISGHQNVPEFYATVSVETELKITTHLKFQLQQWTFMNSSPNSLPKENKDDVLNLPTNKKVMWKDQVFTNNAHNFLPKLEVPQKIYDQKEKMRHKYNIPMSPFSNAMAPVLNSFENTSTSASVECDKKCQELPNSINNTFPKDPSQHCHVFQRRFMIYLCGGYRDTVAERTALMVNVYPQLYLYCKQRGYEFRLVDLHSGISDPFTEHHDSVDLHLEMLKKCQETDGPNFFMFIGQKHEIKSLPTTISQVDFDAILRTVVIDRDRLSRRQSEMENIPVEFQFSITNSSNISSTSESKGPEENHASKRKNSIFYNTFYDGEETHLVRSWADFDRDVTLLQTWYRLDENTIPPVYRLLPISSQHPDILSRDGQRRKAAKKSWYSSCLRLWGVFQSSGPEAIGKEATNHLLRTVLDWEVERGLEGKIPVEEFSHCYKRTITDLLFNLKDEYASQFIDLHQGRAEIHENLQKRQQSLLHNIHNKLRHTNIYEINVSWGKKGISPQHNRSHHFYTERLCSHFQRMVTAALNREMALRPAKSSFDLQRNEATWIRDQEEVQLHRQHGKSLAQGFELRNYFLVKVKDALETSVSSHKVLLLLGDPGSGKSTLLAKVAQDLPTWIAGDVSVLVCFVGLTSDSRNVRLVLQSLCTQICGIHCKNLVVSESLAQLSRDLHSLMMLVNEDKPLALVLDGLDELSEEHEADLSWLYTPLPPHIYTILSASTHSTAANILKQQASVSVLSLPEISSEEITACLSTKLTSDSRRLQEAQQNLLLRSCLSCPSPLYLSLAYSESRSWTSFSSTEHLCLPGDPRTMFQTVLRRLEREHGVNLVRRAASLISLSRAGVTEEELLELLGRDARVAQELTQFHNLGPFSSGCVQVPYVILARLRRDLGCYVTEVKSDGMWLLQWTHAEFKRVTVERYLKTEDSKRAVHADIADYFSCSISDNLIFQPLAWTRQEDGRTSYVFNLRRLHGQPYHLIQSGQILPLFSQCLFNYEFLLHKIWGLSLCHVEEDLKAAVLPEKELPDVHVLTQALSLSQSVLQRDPCQLASQLLGRLLHITAQDKPVAPGDPRRYSYLHDLVSQCQFSSLPVLIPSYSCLLYPGGLSHTLLSGHMSPVNALAVGRHHAVSCSLDGMLNLWKLGEYVTLAKTLPRTGESHSEFPADAMCLCLEDEVLVLRRGHSLQVQDVHSGKVLYAESELLDVPVITSTCDGRMLVVFYDGSHTLKVFDLGASCLLLHCVKITLNVDPIHKDNSILVSQNSVKDHVLFAYRSGSEAAVFSARAGSLLVTLKAQQQAASIQAVEISSQYYLIFCRYPYKRHSDLLHIELFSTASFQYLRSILGCSQDNISQVTINKGGTHVVAFCPSAHSLSTEIVTWNLETEDHKHMARFPGLINTGICSDLRLCMGFCMGDRYLHLWNLASRINDPTLTYNIHNVPNDGTEAIIPMDKYQSYIVCYSIHPGTVRVWNTRRMGSTAQPVRVEHGLFTSSDVAFAQDLKVYILTDRGTSPFTDTPTPVYQTLLVYNLLTKSYIKKQSGLFIVPCPQHDYRLLKGELLLGLSETRDHLIIWDLDSGYIKGRVKTNHGESLLSSSRAEFSLTQWTGVKTEMVMPWDLRTESHTARKRRQECEVQRETEEQQGLDKEKYNSIDQYLLSGDEKVVVCSYFAHHLNVFSVVSYKHLHTLEDRWSLLGLGTAALTHSGRHLVISNYSEVQKSPYLSLWDTHKGRVQKRLKNEPGICCVALTDDASRIAFGIVKSNKLKVWEPFSRKHKTIQGYGGLKLSASSQLYIVNGGAKAILLAGEVSVWDLDSGTVLSIFTPDSKIQCLSVLDDEKCSFLLGFSDTASLISMTLSKKGGAKIAKTAQEDQLFGESSSGEEDEEIVD